MFIMFLLARRYRSFLHVFVMHLMIAIVSIPTQIEALSRLLFLAFYVRMCITDQLICSSLQLIEILGVFMLDLVTAQHLVYWGVFWFSLFFVGKLTFATVVS